MNKKKMTKLQMKTYEVQISPQDTISQKILSKNSNDFFKACHLNLNFFVKYILEPMILENRNLV